MTAGEAARSNSNQAAFDQRVHNERVANGGSTDRSSRGHRPIDRRTGTAVRSTTKSTTATRLDPNPKAEHTKRRQSGTTTAGSDAGRFVSGLRDLDSGDFYFEVAKVGVIVFADFVGEVNQGAGRGLARRRGRRSPIRWRG